MLFVNFSLIQSNMSWHEYNLSIYGIYSFHTSIPVSYGNICVGPARDKRYMAMHGKENKHNQADMHGTMCKKVQSPFSPLITISCQNCP